MLLDGPGIAFANTDTRALLNHFPPVFVLTRLFVRIEVLIKQGRLLSFDNQEGDHVLILYNLLIDLMT
jgi:hypothetical protein